MPRNLSFRFALVGEEPEFARLAEELTALGHAPMRFANLAEAKPWDYLSWGNLVPHDALVLAPLYETLARRERFEAKIKLAYGRPIEGCAAHATTAEGFAAAVLELVPQLARLDEERLARHFWRRSDVVALERLVAERGGYIDRGWPALLAKHYGWLHDRAAYAEHYKKFSATHEGNYEDHSREPRYLEIKTWLERLNLSAGAGVLDFACSYGWFTIELARAFPHLRFTGMDVDAKSLEYARQYALEREVKNAEFIQGTETSAETLAGGYEAVVAAEVLEHVPEPWASLAAIERFARPGASVLITTPYGPWEHLSHHTYPHRGHVWELEHHDLADMFEGRGAEVRVEPAGRSWLTGEAMGWHIASFRAQTGLAVPLIDLKRKLSFQAPL